MSEAFWGWKSVLKDLDAINQLHGCFVTENYHHIFVEENVVINLMSYPPVRLYLADFDAFSSHLGELVELFYP